MAKVVIGVPSSDVWKSGFGLDLAGLVGVFTKTHPTQHQVAVVNAQISILDRKSTRLNSSHRT